MYLLFSVFKPRFTGEIFQFDERNFQMVETTNYSNGLKHHRILIQICFGTEFFFYTPKLGLNELEILGASDSIAGCKLLRARARALVRDEPDEFFADFCPPIEDGGSDMKTPRKFNIAPENRLDPKRKASSSNHPFSGAMLNFGGVRCFVEN